MKSLRASLASVLIALLSLGTARAAAPLKALILDGQNNHDWKSSTPHLKQVIEATGLFAVDVATAPGDIARFGNGGTLSGSATVNVGSGLIGGLIFGATTGSGYFLTASAAETLSLP